MNSYPHYDVLDEVYAKLNATIKIMNEQHKHFVSEMRECGSFHETDPSRPFPRLKASLCDDCKSFLHLESNVTNDAHLTDLEEAFDPPFTSLPFITGSLSSTLMDTSVSDLTLLASPLPLA